MRNKLLTGVSANVILLGLASFLNDLSSEMILAILPMFLTSLGATGIVIGLVGGFRDSIASLLKVFAGYWSDRTGERKKFVWVGYFIPAIFKLFLGFSKIWQHALVFVSLERIGKGLRSAPRDAIVADSMPNERGRGFGIIRTFDTSGAIVGSLIAFVLFWFFGFSFKIIIFAAAILSFTSLIPIFFVKAKKRESQDISLEVGFRKLPNRLKFFIIIASVFAFANFSYMFFILKAQASFDGKWAIGMPILLYALFNIFYAALAIPFGILADRVGKRRVIVYGYLLFSIVCFGFVLSSNSWYLLILFSLYGVAYAMIESNQRAFVSDLAPPEIKATALGTFHTAIGLSALPGSLIAGFLWETLSPETAFVYGGLVGIVATILLMFPKRFFNHF